MKVSIFLFFTGISSALLHRRISYLDESALEQILSSRDLDGLADGDKDLVFLQRRTKESPSRGSPNTPTSPPFARGFLNRPTSGSSAGQGSSRPSSCEGSTKDSLCQGSSKTSPGQESAKGSSGQGSMIGSPSQGSVKGSPNKAAFSPGFLNKGFANKDPEKDTKWKPQRMSSRRRPQQSLNDLELRRRYRKLAGDWPQGDTHNTAITAEHDLNISGQKQAKSKALRHEENKHAKATNNNLAENPNSPNLARHLDNYDKTFEKSQQGLQEYSDAAKQSSKSAFLDGQYHQAVGQLKKSIRADTRKATREDYSKALRAKYFSVNAEANREHVRGPVIPFNNMVANAWKDDYTRATHQYRKTFAAGQKTFEDLSGSSSSEDERDQFKEIERKEPSASP